MHVCLTKQSNVVQMVRYRFERDVNHDVTLAVHQDISTRRPHNDTTFMDITQPTKSHSCNTKRLLTCFKKSVLY